MTILTPCYNVGQYVGKCIESILSQSYQNLQVVMIDDGSTDNTLSKKSEANTSYSLMRMIGLSPIWSNSWFPRQSNIRQMW